MFDFLSSFLVSIRSFQIVSGNIHYSNNTHNFQEALTIILAEIRRSADDALLFEDETPATTASIEAASVYLSAPSHAPDDQTQQVRFKLLVFSY